MGKGDTPRPVNKEKYDSNYEAIFGKREIKTWNPEEDDEVRGVKGNGGGDQSDSGPADRVS